MLRDLLEDILAFLLVMYACLFFWLCGLFGIDLEEDF